MPRSIVRTHRTSGRGTIEYARQLRSNMTPEETLLWSHLRGKALQGLRFRRQHPIGPFIVDFFCSELGLVVEVDGGIHRSAEQKKKDYRRELAFDVHGLQLVRFTNEQVRTNLEWVLSEIIRCVQAQVRSLPR